MKRIEDYTNNMSLLQSKLQILVSEGCNEESPQLYKVAVDMVEEVSSFVEYLEDKDLEAKVGKLKSIDKYFEGDPVSEFTEAAINYHMGNNPELQMKRAMGAINKINKEPKTINDFVNSIVSDLDFTKDEQDYKESFKKEMERVIRVFQKNQGLSHFFVIVGGETISGSLSSTAQGAVTVELLGKEYTFSVKDSCGKNPLTCGREDCCKKKELASKKELSLHEYMESLDESYYTQANEIMDDIEDKLSDQKEYSQRDLDLIRYYLKKLTGENPSIDLLSDRALTLAWNRRKYMKQV